MKSFALLLFCVQTLFLKNVFSQAVPCNGNGISNVNLNGFSGINNIANLNALAANIEAANNCNCANSENALTITGATFTPISDAIANQIGLQGAILSEVIPNLQYGDVTLSGDLPIGGTIKVSGCFPVYGMVAVDGTVPSTGSAIVKTGCQFPAQLAQNPCK